MRRRREKEEEEEEEEEEEGKRFRKGQSAIVAERNGRTGSKKRWNEQRGEIKETTQEEYKEEDGEKLEKNWRRKNKSVAALPPVLCTMASIQPANLLNWFQLGARITFSCHSGYRISIFYIQCSIRLDTLSSKSHWPDKSDWGMLTNPCEPFVCCGLNAIDCPSL